VSTDTDDGQAGEGSRAQGRSFLDGGGELGALIRAKDWAATPLGPIAGWPQSLRTTLGILLNSRYPMFVFWGPRLVKIYNDGYRPITGHKHPWALGREAAEVWPEIWDDIKPLIDRALAGQPTWSDDLMLFMERNGFPEEVYFTFSYSPVPDESGGVGGMFCACTETTRKVLGERRLRTLHDLAAGPADARTRDDACRLSAEVLAANRADIPFALVYLMDADGSARLAAATGVGSAGGIAPPRIPPEDATGGWPVPEVARLRVPKLVTTLGQTFAEVPEGPWAERPSAAMVLPLVEKGLERGVGAIVLGVSSRRPFDAEYREWFGLVATQVGASITNAGAAEEERRRTAALAEIDRAKTVFFSNVSHEFRTPLTLLLGPLEEALGRPDRTLAGADLETSYRNALRLLKLVNGLLDFARLEAGRVAATFEPTDLASLTTELASHFRSAIERAGLRFEVQCEPLPDPLFVDRDMWEKVVLNLLSNALKFTFDGHVRVALRGTPGGAELTVEDSGIGIAPEDLPRLFERFHRIEGARARTHEGSGIGLALVHELVRMHGGTVRAESERGRGTTFVVSLRAGRDHLPPDRVAAAAGERARASAAPAFVDEAVRWLPGAAADGAPPAPARPGRRIVVADDNADMREHLVRLLGQTWRVEAAANGAEALAALHREPADLLITDVMMPGLDGFGLLRAVRSDPACKELPVIMLSARAGEEARIEGLAAGADDYLVKPFSARELIARVASQLEAANARALVTAERDRLRALLTQVPAIVNFLKGPDLVFEFAHPLAVKAVGGRPLLGRPLLEALPEHAGQPYVEMLRQVYATGEPVGGTQSLVRLWQPGSGTYQDRYWNFLYQPVRSATGEIEGVMTFDLDVTEQVQARRQLEEQASALASAREAAEVASRVKDEFLAVLGHELRNPLAPISTALEVMRLRGLQTREQEVIARQVGYLTRLVDDLLDVSRITRGMIELQRRPTELAPIVARAMELASPLLEQRHQQVELEVADRGLAIDADPDRLTQVVTNLVANAAKYSDPGSRIRVCARRDGGEVELAVRDQGIGMARDMLERVFEPFVQEAQTLDRSRGGLGLGLTIVKSLVERHGGRVLATSDGPGRGSVFVVRLPALAADVPPRAVHDVAAAVPGAPEPGGRILVVDDNRDAAEMLKEVLQRLGHTVAVAHDGPSALDIASTFRPGLALLDIGLPVMDGYELAQQLRGRVAASSIRLVALTGYGQEADRQRSAEAGFERHLVKPIDLHHLRAVLQGLAR
jgi:signal transduction histidine kinase